MANSIFFDLHFREWMGAGLKKVQGISRSVFGSVDKDVANTQKGLHNLGAQEYKLRVDTSGIRQAQEEAEKLEQRMRNMGSGGAGIGGAWSMFKGSFAGNLASRGVERGISGIRDIGAEALGAGMDAEQQIIALTTFIGKAKAKALYAELQKESALTPFTTSNILPGIQMLIAGGQTPERAKKDIWSLMNAMSATGNAGNQFALELGESHLAQMASTGRADAYFMKEFQRTLHIPMERLLSDSTGIPQKKISEWTHNGELADHVTYDMFVGAMERAGKAGGMFAGALEAQSQTIKGKSSTIKDWWNIGLAKSVLDPATHDNIIKLEDRLIEGLEKFPDLIGKMSPVINKLFDEFNELWPSMSGFGNSILDLMKPFGGVAMSAEMKEFGKGLLDLGKSLSELATPAVKAFADVLKVGLGNIGEELKTLDSWIKFMKHGDVPTTQGASGMVQAGETMNWWKNAIGLFYPKQFMDASIQSHMNLGIGRDQWKNNQGWTVPSTPSWKGFAGIGTSWASKSKPINSASANETSDAIIGGGRKVININFKNFVEKLYNNVNGKAEGQAWTVNELKIMLNQVLAGVPSN